MEREMGSLETAAPPMNLQDERFGMGYSVGVYHPESLILKSLLVDLIGIEPMTSSMPWKRAPSCATGPRASFNQFTRIGQDFEGSPFCHVSPREVSNRSMHDSIRADVDFIAGTFGARPDTSGSRGTGKHLD
jgi:hypothetical protein